MSNPQTPSQTLALVLNGPGRDPESAVWLPLIDGATEMPRLFAFDVACLDGNHEVVQVASVGPGTPFPALANSVGSVIFLPDNCLAKSGTLPGDVLTICTELDFPVHQKFPPQESAPQRYTEAFFAASVQPAQAPEPFAGSLIFLPESSVPQSSEFFLPAQPMQSSAPELAHEQLANAEAATEPADALSSIPAPSAEFPRNLKAILQQVDKQIRRESISAPEPPPIPHESPPPSIQRPALTPPPAQINEAEPATPLSIETQESVDLAPNRRGPRLGFATRVQRWLAGESASLRGNRRRSERVTIPGLVAFYWTGGAPKPHHIVNISNSGLYLRSKDMWSPNTLVRMTIERPLVEVREKESISVLARVVRVDEGGIGHEFVTTESIQKLRSPELLHEQGTDRKALEKFLTLR